MTDNEIIEGNRLIVKFMGGEKIQGEHGWNYMFDKLWSSQVSANELKYHSDWSWLMPVVEKIEAMGYYVSICGNDCLITDSRHSLIAHCKHFSEKITTVWQAVEAFIQWHNSQQTKNQQ